MRRLLLAPLVVAAACATPMPVANRGFVLHEVVERYQQTTEGVGLLKPRFGLPALALAARPALDVELLLPRGQTDFSAALVDDAGREIALHGDARATTPLPSDDAWSVVAARLHAAEALPPGGYDLVVRRAGVSTRAARAVWLSADDPATRAEVRVAHISDLHLGKGPSSQQAHIRDHLLRVIAEINRLKPDVVVVTGDIANNAGNARQLGDAAKLLSTVAAPVLVIAGNHDHGFSRAALYGSRLSGAWGNFARVFHPELFYRWSLGGWEFLGFDSGPSIFSPLVRTRGIDRDAVRAVEDVLVESQRAGRGVVVFSHAPTRARLTGHRPSKSGGPFGTMQSGGEALEAAFLRAARDGVPIVHLSGHTHWSDVFEADQAKQELVRWDHRRLGPSAQTVSYNPGGVLLINGQSATHTTFDALDNARGYGFFLVTLRRPPAPTTIELHRYENGDPSARD